MKTKKVTVIYIMGAGRSGTTAFATFLGNNKEILNLGEMHQFCEYLDEGKKCSCGKLLHECEFWNKKISKEVIKSISQNRILFEKMESHSSIIKHLLYIFKKNEIKKYNKIQYELLNNICSASKKSILLDSSKYIGRALALNNINQIDLKVIYVVRDVRGVINSFLKRVQTSKSTISSIIYYLLVNLVAEFVSRFFFRQKVIKIRYEDLVEQPTQTFQKVESFLKMDLNDVKQKIKEEKSFKIGHIVGGNRLKESKEIYLEKDVVWSKKFSFLQAMTYYILAAPIMILNKYKF